MTEKSEIRNEQIINSLRDEFGLRVEKISFLPLGADPNTSVCHVVTKDETRYFVKVKKGDFNEASVAIPNFLSTSGRLFQRLQPKQVNSGQTSRPSK